MLETVNAEQIKSFYNGKNNKPPQHADYDYYQTERFEDQVNEFISYSEVKYELKQHETEYNDTFPPWKESTDKDKRDIVQNCIEHLDFIQEELRTNATKILVYISLGNYGEYRGLEQAEDHRQTIKENNQLLFNMNIILTLKQSLNHACHQLETPTTSSQSELVTSYCKEIDMHLTILFMVVESNKDEDQLLDYGLAEFLFDLVVRLKEHFTKTFPLKKLMLTLYKVLLITLGDLNEEYSDLKSNIRILCELPLINDKSTTVKCTPEDLYAFYHQSCERYPTFTPITPLSKIADPLLVSASPQLSKAMGLLRASKNIDLPYQTLFPSKNHQSQQQQQQHHQANGNPAKNTRQSSTEANILPFTESSALEPYSLTEASSIWLNHLYISVANWQIIYEREKAVHRWTRWRDSQQQSEVDEWEKMVYSRLAKHQYEKMQRIEQLYCAIVPNFQSIVVVILKLLLSTVSIGKDKEAEILEDINVTRNRETSSKAVSGILLLLLKWFKTSHVLKFEYLSQVLIDSGCMLLILKLLGLQEVALLASKKTDDDRQSFFGSLQTDNSDDDDDDDDEEENYTNKRNLFWSINLLRVLQMLTKKKTHRILLLVQYKSSAILKRLLKVGHPTMDLYVLKNLKNQIPYMGRKWRSTNMKTISAIYFRCLTSLNDDWLSNPEGSGDMEEGAMKEISLRMLTRLYNGQRYLPSILPTMDEVSGSDSTHFFTNHKPSSNTINETDGSRLPEYTLNEPVLLDDVELDMNFKRDYRHWLENDVYSTDGDDGDDDDDDDDAEIENNPYHHIGTPLPDAIPIPLSTEQLTEEINKLYIEELRREFDEKQQKQRELQLMDQQQTQDGWDQPIVTNTNSWGDPPANSEDVVKSNFFGDDEEADEIEPEVDPLQGINWDSLTEEDLKKRLHMVEEKTVQRWLNVDMDDPRYLKVLNTFDGEVLTDDEGWPI